MVLNTGVGRRIGSTLTWNYAGIVENNLVCRFVVRCLPTAFAIEEFYEETLHSRLIATIASLLRNFLASKDDCAQEDGIVYLITCCARNGRGFRRGHFGIVLFLEDEDRRKLMNLCAGT